MKQGPEEERRPFAPESAAREASAQAPVRTPARAFEESPDAARRREDPYAALAVRALAVLIGVVGAMLVAIALVQRSFGALGLLGQSRLWMGLCMLAGGAGALALSRRGLQRAAATLSLVLGLCAIMLHAWHSGLGTHSIVLGGAILLVAVAGMLVDLPTALALALATLLCIAGLERAERRGALSPTAALAQLDVESRSLSYAMLAFAGLVAAWIVRRQLQATVARASQQEWRMGRLLQLGSDFTWEMDTRGRMTYLSPSFETHTLRGIEEFMLVAQPGGPRVVADGQWELLHADLKARRPYRDRLIHFVASDGVELYFNGSGEPVFDAAGRHTGWWGVSRNATAEVLGQRELQRSQAMLDRLFRLSPDAICVASLIDGRVLLANPAFLQFVGLPESQVMGRNGLEIGFWREQDAMLALGRAIRAQGWVRDFRSRAWSRDGAQHTVLITAAGFDWDGEEVAVMTLRDITETEHAKRDAEAANRAKSSFLATMSHEIRTPLSGVLGLARLLQDRALPQERREAYLGHLVDAAELLTGIVSDVLDLSKIEAGHLQVERIPYNLHTVVWSAFRTFSPMGQERGLEMRCHVAPDAPREVLGDPVRVRQILANYLSNALKFTERGFIEVRLTRRGGDVARIEVRDSGIGVSAALRATVFQPFTQADSSTTRRFGGSGLGLSICRELALLMGGEVGLESDGASGSRVWVELPLAAAAEDDFTTIAAALEEPPQPLRGMRVLLAEDNPVNRLIVGAMLAHLGADVVEATNGREAIRAASRPGAVPHAILMDLHMPEVDGLEATRVLRAQPATAHLPIIALTAAVLEAERAQAHAAGMNGFVSKPAAEADLLRALSAYVPTAPAAPPEPTSQA
jgi:PAS domain S-box-containing protein